MITVLFIVKVVVQHMIRFFFTLINILHVYSAKLRLSNGKFSASAHQAIQASAVISSDRGTACLSALAAA